MIASVVRWSVAIGILASGIVGGALWDLNR